MIVTHSSSPVKMCPRASHQPARITQTTFPRNEPTPAERFATISRPNGHRAYSPMRKDAIPHGIVRMRTHRTIPAAR